MREVVINENGVLECPNCNEEYSYLHHKTVKVFCRGEDDKDVGVITVQKEGIFRNDYKFDQSFKNVPNFESGNPSGRRDGVTIEFECEICNTNPVLQIKQHKGITYIHWE